MIEKDKIALKLSFLQLYPAASNSSVGCDGSHYGSNSIIKMIKTRS